MKYRYLSCDDRKKLEALYATDALGIQDWSKVTIDEFRAKVAEYNANNGFSEFAEQSRRMRRALEQGAESAKPLPHLLRKNMQDGVYRYTSEDNSVNMAIFKEGDTYRLYDYDGGNISRSMTVQEVNKEFNKFWTTGQTTSTQTMQYTEGTNLARETTEIDALAAREILGYQSMSEPNKAAVRMTIRQARANGLAEAETLVFAKVAAKSGLNIIFDGERAFGDGSIQGNTIVVNPNNSAERTRKATSYTAERRLFLGKISDSFAERIEKATGISAKGTSIALSSSDIGHIFKNHGITEAETTRGQVPVTYGNIEDVIETLIAPDEIERSDDGDIVGVMFRKNINGRVSAVTIVSNKKKTLTLKSAWIQKEKQSTSPSADADASTSTPKTERRMKTTSGESRPADVLSVVTDKSATTSTIRITENAEKINPSDENSSESAPKKRFALPANKEERVLAHFGKPYNWRETGYIFKDGTRLDLSGRNDGAPGGYRSVDHREIFSIEEFENGDTYGTEALIEFMQRGNIRVMPETPGINLILEPTDAQYDKIADTVERLAWKKKYFFIDFDNSNGDTVDNLT